jgi:hypothetical protein
MGNLITIPLVKSKVKTEKDRFGDVFRPKGNRLLLGKRGSSKENMAISDEDL